jgi:hypothetical protein
MNCEQCQDLISDLLEGSLSRQDQSTLDAHLEECLTCADVRNDLQSIVSFCQANRGVYTAPPNERALWLRIRNVIEAEVGSSAVAAAAPTRRASWLSRTWELSFSQMAAAVAAIILVVALTTIVAFRRYQEGNPADTARTGPVKVEGTTVRARFAKQQQLISFWNQRVEYNKARWTPQMRETFDRNLQVIDQTVNDSLNTLTKNPQDEVSEEMLNSALNEKLALLKEFAEL